MGWLRAIRCGWWQSVLGGLLQPFRGSWFVTVAGSGIGLITPTGLHEGGLDGLNRRNWRRIRCCGGWWRRNWRSGGHLNRWSWLKRTYPDHPEMYVSHETIYLSLFVQGKGALRRELTECLRTGRAYRRPKTKRAPSGKGQIVDPVMISERPAEVEDRAVPGHWEGDLLMGKRQTAIGTLVERHTRYVMLFPLPDGNTAQAVRDALTETVQRLPDHLWKSVTWDQGKEMAQHAQFKVDTGIQVFFCDPKSPWQRGTNENTNGLLRQYFPKGTDMSRLTQHDLDEAAHSLNTRPRQTLRRMTPSDKLAEALQ